MRSLERKAILAYLKRRIVQLDDSTFVVNGRYHKGRRGLAQTVTMDDDGTLNCGCEGFNEAGHCKHTGAVKRYLEKGPPTRPYEHVDENKRPTYPQDNARYKIARRIMMDAAPLVLHDLANDEFPVTGKRVSGRPRTEMRDLVLCIALRALYGIGGTRAQSFVDGSFAKKLLYRRPVMYAAPPSEAAITSNMRKPDVEEAFHTLIRRSNDPYRGRVATIALDGSEFEVPNKRDDDGTRELLVRNQTVKLHGAVEAGTGFFLAAIVTDGKSNEQLQSQELVERCRKVRFVERVLADRGYMGDPFFGFLKREGIEWEIPVKSNTSEDGDTVLAQYAREWRTRSDARKTWYGMRQSVESAFSRIKRLLGERLRSKTIEAQRVELLSQVLLGNVMWLIADYVDGTIDLPFLSPSTRRKLDKARDAVADHPRADRSPRHRDGLTEDDVA